TPSWKGSGVTVWDARTEKLVRHLTHEDASACFSPDGKWLVTGSQKEYVFWEVGRWHRGIRIPRNRGYVNGVMAFAPNGQLLAIANSRWDVQLIDPATGLQMATLANPESQCIDFLAFSADGIQLAMVTSPIEPGRGRSSDLRIVDLRAIRRQLAKMGLDWDLHPYPPCGFSLPCGPEGKRSKPLQV